MPAARKLLTISATSQSGVCLLESGSKLHGCWRSATGYHYRLASRDGVFQLTTWSKLALGRTALWVVREDGELYCVTPGDKLARVECSDTVALLAASPTALWVYSHSLIWSRQGMTDEVPEGISWDYIELTQQLHERKLRHIACGRKAVWAIDSTGVPHFRFGVHAREPGTGMSPAWISVDDTTHNLTQISVSSNDWLVWACDEHHNAYARTGVTRDFPVGKAWMPVLDERVKEVCTTEGKVFALTPSGELLYRYGVSETNVQGYYWRRLPGKFAHIAVNGSGGLWTLDEKGAVLKQEWKELVVSTEPSSKEEEAGKGIVDPTWELIP